MSPFQQHVIQHFNQTHAHYRRLWRLDKHLGMHIGFFDEQHRSHDEAVLNMNRVLARTADVSAGDHVLDLGCGIGGSALWLAENIGCRVTGVNINPAQLDMARRLAAGRRAADRLEFFEADFCFTGLPERSADVVWALESAGYAEDKRRFLREARRLLRPGGRLVVADAFLARLPCTSDERRVVGTFQNGWALAPLARVEEFVSEMTRAGFDDVAARDVTPHVIPSSRRMFAAGVVLLPLARLFRRAGLLTPVQLHVVEAACAQFAARRLGLGVYAICSGRVNRA